MNKIINFWNGRSAMNYGIDLLGLKKNSIILLPEIICDVAVKVFLNKKLRVKFYKLNSDFEPFWSEIDKLKSKNISAILMVHFFGYPQKHKKFLKFAKKKNIFLIEDNCHSLPIKLDNVRLGKIGHIGVDSPRKIIDGLYSGGRLFVNFNMKISHSKIKNFETNNKDFLKLKLKQNFRNIYKYYKFKGKRPKYESPYLYSDKDSDFAVKLIDKKSLEKIRRINLKNEHIKRKNLYFKIDKFAKLNGMKPIFKMQRKLIPMYYVARAKNHEHARNIFNWGWNNKIQIVSWPSFYKKHRLTDKFLNRWKKYICFPLNQEFPNINEKKI